MIGSSSMIDDKKGNSNTDGRCEVVGEPGVIYRESQLKR